MFKCLNLKMNISKSDDCVLANIIDYIVLTNEFQGTYVSAKDSLDLGVLLWSVVRWLEPAPLEQT